MNLEADFVVIGAGSAGCVLASRLSEDGSKVVLLEAGGRDTNPFIHIPLGVAKLLHHPTVNWNYASEPEERTGLRPIHWPRGKVLGGSSSINGMLYVRGNPADFDTWADDMGCDGWRFDDLLALFMKSERYDGGDDAWRGRSGPMQVQDYDTILPVTHHFVDAAKAAGFGFNPDLNGPDRVGVGYSQMTRQGRRRASTAATFLSDARKRSNLQIETNAMASRLLLDGQRCTGVEYLVGDEKRVVNAKAEVIVSAGAVNSPHLLQISGIGAPNHLSRIGVDVNHALEGVGKNLSDHYVTRVVNYVKDTPTINSLSRGPRLWKEALVYALQGKGALTFGVTSAQVFTFSGEGLEQPDLQLLFTPASYDPTKPLTRDVRPGVSVAICPVHPKSRGTIMAESSHPFEPPAIRPNYLADDEDIRVMKAGIRHAQRIFREPPLKDVCLQERDPGPDCDNEEKLEAFIRERGATLYHPVGTCKMGKDASAVVDPRLRVHGIDGLRVADASIMPTLTTGNTNAPTIMIGEKAAAMIREDHAST